MAYDGTLGEEAVGVGVAHGARRADPRDLRVGDARRQAEVGPGEALADALALGGGGPLRGRATDAAVGVGLHHLIIHARRSSCAASPCAACRWRSPPDRWRWRWEGASRQPLQASPSRLDRPLAIPLLAYLAPFTKFAQSTLPVYLPTPSSLTSLPAPRHLSEAPQLCTPSRPIAYTNKE